jgi:hypothetical protein
VKGIARLRRRKIDSEWNPREAKRVTDDSWQVCWAAELQLQGEGDTPAPSPACIAARRRRPKASKQARTCFEALQEFQRRAEGGGQRPMAAGQTISSGLRAWI